MPIAFVHPDPARAETVEALESRLGARLPVAFRELLTTLSNGGEAEPVVAQSGSAVGVVAVLGAGRGDRLGLEARVVQYQGGRLPNGLGPGG